MNNFKKALFFSGFTLLSFIIVIDYAVAENFKACCTVYLLFSEESICKDDVSYSSCEEDAIGLGLETGEEIDVFHGPGVCLDNTCETDSDDDGTADIVDYCPYDPNKTSPGACGCGNPETTPCDDDSGGGNIVNLTSFTTTVSDGKVELKWETASEIDNAGFHLWRAVSNDWKGGDYSMVIRLTDKLISAKGDGASYSYKDSNVKFGVTYYYALEDIDLFGQSTFHQDFIDSATVK